MSTTNAIVIGDSELKRRMEKLIGDRVTREGIEARIANVEFHHVGGTVTLCNIELDNGYSVRGESACIDPSNFDEEVGKRYAYDHAFEKLWPLFGFLLAEIRAAGDES